MVAFDLRAPTPKQIAAQRYAELVDYRRRHNGHHAEHAFIGKEAANSPWKAQYGKLEGIRK